MKQPTESECEKIVDRTGISNQSMDYLRINGKANAVGESAERHGIITQRTWAARYSKDYYGVLAAATLGRLYDRSRELAIFGSHPKGDVKFLQDLMEAVVGDSSVSEFTGQIRGLE